MASTSTKTTTYDATGIDLDGIKKMIAAINTYQDKVKNSVKKMASYGNNKTIMDHAMKGPKVQEQYKAAETGVINASTNLVKKLSAFQSTLDQQVRNAYSNTVTTVAKSSFAQAQSIR